MCLFEHDTSADRQCDRSRAFQHFTFGKVYMEAACPISIVSLREDGETQLSRSLGRECKRNLL